ncbi:class I SAM-dependent methyltransferase [Halomontanus rarus]|uniref:class I SAM-dependent methyltransferase n=1 Tax=Halomontanus rarus TaxID=3034020 RepID=UPI0023E8E5C5|nr:class I SAM-dependent methyltransferase [Halovivax sp. TS33]
MTREASSPEEQAKRVWTLGSYSDIAPHFLSMAARLVDATDVSSNDAVLDVGCGTGNVAITAARRDASVTGLDITPVMLDAARENAAIAGIEDISWREGTATDLPFDDDTFDVTLSCVGHMFAEPPDAAAQELLRVTRSSGQIAFTSWTPTSIVPAMGKTVTEYLPPNPDAPDPPFLWGDPDVVGNRLGDDVDELVFETGTVLMPVLSPAHYWEAAVTQSGMFIVALENINEDDRMGLREEMIKTIEQYFDESLNGVPMEYRLTKAVVG